MAAQRQVKLPRMFGPVTLLRSLGRFGRDLVCFVQVTLSALVRRSIVSKGKGLRTKAGYSIP